MIFEHKSVLLKELLEQLNIKADGIYVDGTLGGAGHAMGILDRLSDSGRLIGIDQDEAAIITAKERLSAYKNKAIIIRDNYANIKSVLTAKGIDFVDGIYLDLGVSSHQLDTVERGFTYRYDTALDMRMDKRNPLTAKQVVNEYTEHELYKIIKNYGEDLFAKNIAKHIVRARIDKTIETTSELIDIIRAAIPMKMQLKGGHPAKRTFQAIRIEVNRELEVLENSLETMIDLLSDRGRMAVITFHSLEDRIVKKIYRRAEAPCTCPKNFPICVCGKRSKGKIITRKAILPSLDEIENNPRSRSAKLRVFEKRVNYEK